MVELDTIRPFFEDKQDLLEEILGRYPEYGRRSAVMPLLWEVQRAERYIAESRMEEIAQIVGITATEVKGVLSFYSTYHEQPVGRWHLQVCSTLSCSLAGSDQLYDYLTDELGLVDGETDSDGRFSLQKVECVGSCTTAPVLMVNDTYYERVTRSRCRHLLEALRAGEQPEPWPARGGDTSGAEKPGPVPQAQQGPGAGSAPTPGTAGPAGGADTPRAGAAETGREDETSDG